MGSRIRAGRRRPPTRTAEQQLTRIARLSVAALVLQLVLIASGLVVASATGVSAGRVHVEESQSWILSEGLLEQRLAIDGYMKHADDADLTDYGQSRARSDPALRLLRARAAGTSRAGLISQAAAAVTAWEGWADGIRARVTASGPATDAADVEREARLFSSLRSALSTLTAGLEADYRSAGQVSQWATGFAGGILLVGGVGIAVIPLELGRRVKRPRSQHMRELADAATKIAAGEAVPVPHTERSDEAGLLANALQSVQNLAAEREVLIDQAPVGICRVDNQRVIMQVNTAMANMLGYTKEELTGRSILELRPLRERQETTGALPAFIAGESDLYMSERLWQRKDSSEIWCSLRVAAVRPRPGAPPLNQIAIAEDITERKRQAQQAAQIQRQLLPTETPRIEGYDLAGICRPSLDVAGDFYDWMVSPDGQLDITLADVMGKGVAAGLVMATLRATLRAMPIALGPLERARAMSESLAAGITDEGLFVTLFNCRLEIATGELRYMDAGHGHFTVQRPDGQLLRLAKGCMPLGVQDSEGMEERTARLEPGDTLIVYSDGLVENDERTASLAELAGDLVDAECASDVVSRLMDRIPSHPADDVTVVVLRRLPVMPARARAAG
jgi:PAS domain S-box-containing protein